MRLKCVRLQNIRSYISEEIIFPDGSLLLSGDIGSGKSTILLAIEFALFGIMKGSVDGSSLLRHGKSSGYVELEFELEGREIVIRRSLKRNHDAIGQSSGYIVIDGLRTECTPVELKARILEMLGYPKSLLSKSKSLIYRYTVYTPQEEMKHILFEDAAARLDTLRKVFQIDNYKTIRDNAAIVARALKERIAEYSARTEDLPAKRKQLDGIKSKLREAAARLDLLLPLLKANQEKVKAHYVLVTKYDDDMRNLSILRAEVAALEAASREKNNLVKSLTDEIAQLKKLVASYDASLSDSSLSAEYAACLAALHHHISDLGLEASLREQFQREIDNLQGRFTLISGEVVKAESQKLSSKKLEQNILSSETCPACLQPVSEQHKAHFRQKVSIELESAEKTLAEKGLEQKQVSIQLSAAKEKFAGTLEKERRLAQVSAMAAQYAREAEELGIKAAGNGISYSIPVVLEKLSSASRLLREKARIKSIAAEKKSQLEALENRFGIVNAEAAAIRQQASEKRQQLLPFLTLENDFSVAKSRLERLQQEEKELLIRKASLDKEIENLEGNSQQLGQEIERKEEEEKLLEQARQLRHWLDEYFINLTEVIEKSVMLRIYTEFNQLFQLWFGILMEDEAISARLDDSFSPVVEINGYETQIESLSGGEKTSCALAYRLALNKVINDVITTIKTRDVLILDEPTDGFSSEQLEKVRDVLEQLQLPQIIIVSHESKVESFVQHVVRVVKEQHISHVLG